MSLTEQYFEGDAHPIDIVEALATHHGWEYERLSDEQITFGVEGQWRNYAVTLAWSDYDETLRLICSFEVEPPQERLPQLMSLLNDINDRVWAGSFTYWAEQKVMMFRYGLVLTGGQPAGEEQIDTMVGTAVMSAERYYPAMQLVLWGGKTPGEALQIAIAEGPGHA